MSHNDDSDWLDAEDEDRIKVTVAEVLEVELVPVCDYEDCDDSPEADGYCKRHTGGEYQPTSAEEDDPFCQGDSPRRAHD